MAVNVETTQSVVASSGAIRIVPIPDHELAHPELSSGRVFRVIKHEGQQARFMFTIGLTELRDLYDAAGDLITYFDTAQPDQSDSAAFGTYTASAGSALNQSASEVA